MTKLRNRAVLLTSCASPLGYALAIQLALKGANLVLWDSNGRQAERIASEIVHLYTVQAIAVQVDLRNRDQVFAAVRHAMLPLSTTAPVTVVVHAVDSFGEAHGQVAANTDAQHVDAMLQLHTLSSLWLVKALLPSLLDAKQGGHFVLMSSSATLMGATSGLVDYAASKYALVGLTRSLQYELERLEDSVGLPADQRIQLTTVLAPLEYSKRSATGRDSTEHHSKTKSERGWMQPDVIAAKTIRAVKRNKREVVLPVELPFVHALCPMLPQSWSNKLLDMFQYAPSKRAQA